MTAGDMTKTAARSIDKSPDWDRTRDMLRAAGLRPTRPRLVVGTLALCRPQHMCLADLAAKEEVIATRISLASLYNILDDFEAAGLIRRIAVGGRRVYFDTDPSDHQHIYDDATGTLTDVSGVVVKLHAPVPAGYQLSRTDVLIRVNTRPSPIES